MRKIYIEEVDYDIGTLYVGTAREMKSLYKNLEAKTPAFPLFVDDSEFVEGRMYGIHVQPDGFYTVLNANTCLLIITESFHQMDNVEKYKDHTDHVLDEIISEIEDIHEGYPFTSYIDLGVQMSDIKKIINKHKSESVE